MVSKVWNELKEARMTRFPKRPAADQDDGSQKKLRLIDPPTGPTPLAAIKVSPYSIESDSAGTSDQLIVQRTC